MATKTMTETGYARHRGVARKTVTVWKAKGLLVWLDGGIHAAATDAILDARPRHFRGGTTNRRPADVQQVPDAPETFTSAASWTTPEAQRRKEIALALTRELALARLRGKIVDVEDIQPGWTRVVLAVRSAMLAIPGRARIALQLTDVQTEELRRIIKDALTAAALGDAAPPIDWVAHGAAE